MEPIAGMVLAVVDGMPPRAVPGPEEEVAEGPFGEPQAVSARARKAAAPAAAKPWRTVGRRETGI
ncbi:hypothetical protein [Streptomyces sp. NPDC058424]|uniref:hypothetical protein n=1 Tax=Streptomyces sp. NPDC058424 TaxID=3346491 RepID=UPI003650D7F6